MALRTAEPPARPRGQVMLALLTASVPLQVSFDQVAALPPEHWDPRVFSAMNPRALLPVAETLALLTALGKNSALQAFRAWTERLSRSDVFDDERDRLSALAFSTLLDGDFAWLPALAWVLDRLPWEVILPLAREEFGEQPDARAPANERYRSVELAILRENLLRAYGAIDRLWEEAFAVPEGGATPKSFAVPAGLGSTPCSPLGLPPKSFAPLGLPPSGATRKGQFPPLAYRVLHLARLYVAARYGSSRPSLPSLVEVRAERRTLVEVRAERRTSPAQLPSALAYRGPGPKDDRVLSQGSLGHVIRWRPGAHHARRKVEAVLRHKAAALPEWTRFLLRAS